MSLLRAVSVAIACACAPQAGASDFDARLATVANRLAAQATRANPRLQWKFTTSHDPSAGAYFTAPASVVVGEPFVQRLALDDAGLAMLVAHEMAHGLAGHRRKRLDDRDGDRDPAAQVEATGIAQAQEQEADCLGLELAHAAGWPLARLLAFFDQLATAEPAGTFSASHAQASKRAADARECAAALVPGVRRTP